MFWRARGAWWLVGAVLCLAMTSGCGYLDQELALSDDEYAATFGDEGTLSREITLEEMSLYGRYGCGGGWGRYHSGVRIGSARLKAPLVITGEAALEDDVADTIVGAGQQAAGGRVVRLDDPRPQAAEQPPRDVIEALSKRHQRFASEVTGKLAVR